MGKTRVPRVRHAASRAAGRAVLACVVAATLLTACDESFSPIEPSAFELSIYGAIDASADTQWIRLTPIRPLVLTPPGPLGEMVTLEEVGTGRVIELHDSVFRFSPPDTTVGSEGIYLHNYWTTEDIQPDTTYRLIATVGQEEPSEATLKIPAEYGVELWLHQSPHRKDDSLRLVGLRHVAFVVVDTHFTSECTLANRQRVHFGTGSPDTEIQMIPISRPVLPQGIGCPPPRVEARQIFIVGSGEAWPTNRKYAPSSLGTPLASNVSHAVGYLGGVLTHLIPYDHCRIENADPSDYCRLHYDSTSVTLRGIVSDPVCKVLRLPDAVVELRELDLEPPTKIRYDFSNSSGAYVIGALEPDKHYAMSVTHPDDGHGEFVVYTDTVSFTSGEQATYDVALQRKWCED